jgi:hypothetical protein
MTEIDYSPEAYERHLATQRRIAHWAADACLHSHEFQAPAPPLEPTLQRRPTRRRSVVAPAPPPMNFGSGGLMPGMVYAGGAPPPPPPPPLAPAPVMMQTFVQPSPVHTSLRRRRSFYDPQRLQKHHRRAPSYDVVTPDMSASVVGQPKFVAPQPAPVNMIYQSPYQYPYSAYPGQTPPPSPLATPPPPMMYTAPSQIYTYPVQQPSPYMAVSPMLPYTASSKRGVYSPGSAVKVIVRCLCSHFCFSNYFS